MKISSVTNLFLFFSFFSFSLHLFCYIFTFVLKISIKALDNSVVAFFFRSQPSPQKATIFGTKATFVPSEQASNLFKAPPPSALGSSPEPASNLFKAPPPSLTSTFGTSGQPSNLFKAPSSAAAPTFSSSQPSLYLIFGQKNNGCYQKLCSLRQMWCFHMCSIN